MTTTERPSENPGEVDSDVIIDVLKNFISEQDPILELFISVCFVHPDCFQVGNIPEHLMFCLATTQQPPPLLLIRKI